MAANKLYSIGEVSKLCNISTKALRFYDKIGVIAPDEVGENGYRYYTLDTILRIPILKYYKQMGFRLEEMQGLVKGGDYYVVDYWTTANEDEFVTEIILPIRILEE